MSGEEVSAAGTVGAKGDTGESSTVFAGVAEDASVSEA